jgi:hypothetical protein
MGAGQWAGEEDGCVLRLPACPYESPRSAHPAWRGPACAGRASPRLSPALTPGQRRRRAALTLPEQIEAGHVDFARQLAAKAWAYAVAVERRYRGLPPLPDVPVPYTLTAKAEALLDTEQERADLVPLTGGREVTA